MVTSSTGCHRRVLSVFSREECAVWVCALVVHWLCVGCFLVRIGCFLLSVGCLVVCRLLLSSPTSPPSSVNSPPVGGVGGGTSWWILALSLSPSSLC